MRNLLAAFAFSVVVGLLVYNAQLATSESPPAPPPEAPIPKIEQRRWVALSSPAPAPSLAPAARDIFASPK